MVPNIMVVVGYNDIYGDYTKVNVPDLLKGIPTLSLLHYITEQTSKVIYMIQKTKSTFSQNEKYILTSR